jgi:hypothetical protein
MINYAEIISPEKQGAVVLYCGIIKVEAELSQLKKEETIDQIINKYKSQLGIGNSEYIIVDKDSNKIDGSSEPKEEVYYITFNHDIKG